MPEALPSRHPSKSTGSTAVFVDTNPSDAIALLEADHRSVVAMFEDFDVSMRDAAKRSLVNQVCKALNVHAQLEEEIFYPACRAGGVDKDLLDEADVEHAAAKELIAAIEGGRTSDKHWDAKVLVLAEQVEHHIKAEEGVRGIFAQARWAGLDLDALGIALAARKAELMA